MTFNHATNISFLLSRSERISSEVVARFGLYLLTERRVRRYPRAGRDENTFRSSIKSRAMCKGPYALRSSTGQASLRGEGF